MHACSPAQRKRMRSGFNEKLCDRYLHDENIAASKRVGELIVVVSVASEAEVSS